MVKRRRERDRPKAAHDALYNPNKRILLSYASDDESERADQQPASNGADLSTVHSTTAAVEAEEGVESVEALSKDSAAHRELFEEAWHEGVEEEVDSSEPIPNDGSLWTRKTTKNTTTGQWAALGSLSYQWEEDEDDDEDYDSTEEEAMSYLRAVRSERQSMPTVLKSTKTYSNEEIYESGLGDTRGYYEDGAYVARASLGPELPSLGNGGTQVEPQEAFTRALNDRFLKQRELLHLPPEPDALQQLDQKHPISFPAKNGKAYAEWHKLIRSTAPLPAQVRAMQQEEVLRLIELIQKFYLARETEITSTVSAWIWALLARLDDVGGMDNDQVWVIRELGRKAVLVQLSFNNSAAAKQLASVAAGEDAIQDRSNATILSAVAAIAPETDGIEEMHAKAPEQATPDNTKHSVVAQIRSNTLATLDAILVVVGEVFGQRDLLEFRNSWVEDSAEAHGI